MRSKQHNKIIGCHKRIDHEVCDTENEECMTGMCQDCPGEAGVDMFLSLILHDEECVTMDHMYKQWVSTDRCELIDVRKDWDDFTHDLSVSVVKLTIQPSLCSNPTE